MIFYSKYETSFVWNTETIYKSKFVFFYTPSKLTEVRGIIKC